MPSPTQTLDTGPAACGELIMRIFQTMQALHAEQMLEVLAYDPAADLDIPAWCRMTGHALLWQDTHSLPKRFLIQKCVSSASPLTPESPSSSRHTHP